MGIHAQSLAEIQDLIKHNSTENCETKLFQNVMRLFIFTKLSRPGNCCFKISRLFQVFHDRMDPECDDRVRLSKTDKNIGAGSWRVDNIFEAADLGDVLAHLCITNVYHSTRLKRAYSTNLMM